MHLEYQQVYPEPHNQVALADMTFGGKVKMWSNFVIAVEAVLPIFIIMGVGMFIRHKGLVSEYDVKKMNKTVFAVFFPVLMFSNLYGKEIKGGIDGKIIAFSVARCCLSMH